MARIPASLAFSLALILAGCGGDSTQAPAGLTYATNPATYTRGVAIAANAPRSGGDAVETYAVSPALPAGLSLDPATGVLSGTPAAIAARAAYVVTAANRGGSATVSLSVAVNDVPPSGLAYASGVATYVIGTAIAPNAPTSGGGAVVSYTVHPALPAGLSLDGSTGVITGTPTAVAPSATHVVTATNSGGSAEAGLVIRVNDVAPYALTYGTNPATYTRGEPIAPNLPTHFGGVATSWSVTPALPAGLSLDPASGILSGAATVLAAPTTYTVTATNSGGSTIASLSLAVNDAPPSGLSYASNPAAYATGTAIPPNVPSIGGGPVVDYAVSPALPAGLSLHGTTGVISGTPAAITPAADYTVTARNTGGSAQAVVRITVTLGAPANLAYPVNPARYGRYAAVTPNVPSIGGGAVAAYAVSPGLPDGLTLDPATGVLSGTPTALAATATHVVTASNAAGSTQASVSVTVVDLPVVSVAVGPATGDVTAGGATLALAARATFEDSTSGNVTAHATWSTDAEGQVDVTGGGVASAPLAARVGVIGTVTATFGGRQGSSSLRVVRGPALGPTLGNDPLALQQWYLVNTGQTAYSDRAGTAGEDLRLGNALALGLRGSGVKVAVVDTGLEIAHPDLAGNVVPGSWNFVTGTSDPSPSPDTTGGDHGTSVSGIIGMRYDNGIGGMGIAPAAGLNGYNFLQVQTLASMTQSLGGSSANPRSDDVWIFNQSYGTSAPAPVPVGEAIEAQYLAGVTTLRSGKGALYVKSAGNGFRSFTGASCGAAQAIGVSCQNASMDGKNAVPYNVVVGALDARGRKSVYSSAGSALWVSAPGGQYGYNASVAGAGYPDYAYEPALVTTDRTGCALGYAVTGAATSAFNRGSSPNALCDYANTFNGTSSAAPATVGAIALLLDARPDLTWRDVKHILATSARRVDPDVAPVVVALSNGAYTAELPWTRNAAGMWFHNWYGFGAVDVDAALGLARTHGANSLGTFVVGGWIASGAALGLAIPDDSVTGASSTIAVASGLTVESIQVEVAVTHAAPGDLGIELTSPSGSRSILLNIRNGFAPAPGLLMVAESNLFYGEPAAGEWTLKIVDGFAVDTGTLDQWKIRVFGH